MFILTHRWRNVTIYLVLRSKSASKRYKCWIWKVPILRNISNTYSRHSYYNNSKNESSTTRRVFPTGFWFSSRANLLWNGAHANANHEPTKYVSKHSTTMWTRCSISTAMAILSRPNSGCLPSHARKRSLRVNMEVCHQFFSP